MKERAEAKLIKENSVKNVLDNAEKKLSESQVKGMNDSSA